MAGDGERALTELRVSPRYFSAVNALTRPNQVVFCSRYFVRRWMPLLGGTGTQIVLYLRSLGFYNRQTGELRDEIPVRLRDIADACRCSAATVRREFAGNEVLGLFVQVRHRWEPDPSSGQPRQCENGYRVAMDDPPHEADLDWLRAYLAHEDAVPEDMPTPTNRKSTPPNQNERGVQIARGVGRKLQAPPNQNERVKTPDTKKADTNTKDTSPTLNVGEADNYVVSEQPAARQTDRGAGRRPGNAAQAPKNLLAEALDREVAALVEELRDLGSERRHRQLLSICDQHGLHDLPQRALQETRKRLSKEGRKGAVEKPGAYYQRVLIALLEEHQVFVPKVGEDDPAEVRRLIRASLEATPET